MKVGLVTQYMDNTWTHSLNVRIKYFEEILEILKRTIEILNPITTATHYGTLDNNTLRAKASENGVEYKDII